MSDTSKDKTLEQIMAAVPAPPTGSGMTLEDVAAFEALLAELAELRTPEAEITHISPEEYRAALMKKGEEA